MSSPPLGPGTVTHHGSIPRPDGHRPADEPTLPTDPTDTTTTHMPMMHPEDEANSDAPLVPDMRATNRPATAEMTDLESAQREIRWIRARLADVESRLTTNGERR